MRPHFFLSKHVLPCSHLSQGAFPWVLLVCFSTEDLPLSVLGSATVTLTVQHSQQTSSSPLMASQVLRRFFSKNWTEIWPLPEEPPPPWGCLSSWRARAATRWSIMVSSSTSSTRGRVRSRTSRVCGVRVGKKRWKNIVCRIP